MIITVNKLEKNTVVNFYDLDNLCIQESEVKWCQKSANSSDLYDFREIYQTSFCVHLDMSDIKKTATTMKSFEKKIMMSSEWWAPVGDSNVTLQGWIDTALIGKIHLGRV